MFAWRRKHGETFGMFELSHIASPVPIRSSASKTTTIGARLDLHRGWTNGFDYMRLVLACSVIGWHSVFTSYGYRYEAGVYASWIHVVIYPILPMFFALGGFLVAASLFRSQSVAEYLLLRVLRFFPALLVVIVLSTFVLGPLLTSVPLPAYFHDPMTFHYLLNALGWFEEALPGVFSNNPAPDLVNVSLWTIPWEFGCSVVLSALMFCRPSSRGTWLAVVSVLVMLLVPTVAIATHTEAGLFSRPPGHLLAMAFCAGVCLFYFRYRIPFSFPIFIACLALSLLLFMRAKSGYLAVIPIGYVTIYLGLQHPTKYGFMKRADLSYGVYLYGCVMQQMVISLFPAMRVWWINWAVSLSLALACAAGSWYLVESQVLRRRRQIIARLLSLGTSTPAVVADRNASSSAVVG